MILPRPRIRTTKAKASGSFDSLEDRDPTSKGSRISQERFICIASQYSQEYLIIAKIATQLYLISQLFLLSFNLLMLLLQSSPPTMRHAGVQHLIDAAACVHKLHGLLCLKDGVSLLA